MPCRPPHDQPTDLADLLVQLVDLQELTVEQKNDIATLPAPQLCVPLWPQQLAALQEEGQIDKEEEVGNPELGVDHGWLLKCRHAPFPRFLTSVGVPLRRHLSRSFL